MTGKTFTEMEHRAARAEYLDRTRARWRTMRKRDRRAFLENLRVRSLHAGPNYPDPSPRRLAFLASWPIEETVKTTADHYAGTELVTEHTPPWRQVELEACPSAALSFARAAQRAGLTVAARMAGQRAVQIGVRHHDRNALWMRATWTRNAVGAWTTKGVAVGAEQRLGTTAARALWSA